ncbi:MAG TPA: enoyl-CoA hydratase-related protein [Rhizomicrobium sp.]|nr:enoyl-CoA hydratase-related protein [Rhizomicrobium sp.]
MSAHRLSFAVEEGIARIALDNAAGRNAIDLAFVEAFADCAERCADEAVKVVLISAQGPYFSVGGDLSDFVAHADDAERHILAMARKFHVGVARLHELSVPVVLALGGMAAGGGFSLVCGADFVIASRSAGLTSAYTRTGLTPDGGLTWFLERIVGARKAFEIMALNPVMSADEAFALGIVNRLVDRDALQAESEAVARQIANTPSDSLRALKWLMTSGRAATLESQLEHEAVSIARQAGRAATMENLRKFLARG